MHYPDQYALVKKHRYTPQWSIQWDVQRRSLLVWNFTWKALFAIGYDIFIFSEETNLYDETSYRKENGQDAYLIITTRLSSFLSAYFRRAREGSLIIQSDASCLRGPGVDTLALAVLTLVRARLRWHLNTEKKATVSGSIGPSGHANLSEEILINMNYGNL